MNAIQTLGDVVSKLGKQINDLQREVAGRRSHAHHLSIELKQSEIERQKLESTLGELRSSVDSERGEIITELQLANDAIARLEASNNALSADCNTRQQQVVQATAEIDRMRKELTQHCEMKVQYESAIERLTKELNDARERLENMEAARNDLSILDGSLKVDCDSLIKDKESLVDEIKALQFTVEKRNEAILDAIAYINSLPPWVSGADEIAITAPVEKRLFEILSQGAPK